MIYGYLRVNTPEQPYKRQMNKLEKAGAEKIIKEVTDGRERPEIERLINEVLKDGDTLIVDNISSMSVGMSDVINKLKILKDSNIEFICLNKGYINTKEKKWKHFGEFIDILSQYQSEIIRERKSNGYRKRREAGKRTGGKKILQETKEQIVELYNRGMNIVSISNYMYVSRPTIYKILRESGIEIK